MSGAPWLSTGLIVALGLGLSCCQQYRNIGSFAGLPEESASQGSDPGSLPSASAPFAPEASNGQGLSPACRIHVDRGTIAIAPDGKSWASAFSTVQAGIEAASARAPCEVWIAQGTYEIYRGTDDDSVVLRAGVAVYGGFSGQETSPKQRQIRAHPTVLDGQGKIHHVVSASTDSSLDGFVITGGRASGSSPQDRGGGMLILGGAVTIDSCVFRGNRAEDDGGGVYHAGANLTVRNCSFEDNQSLGSGGGLASVSGALTVVSSVFFRNRADREGGAIWSDGGAVSITQGTFTRNTVDNYQSGGAFALGEAAISHGSREPLRVWNSIAWGDVSGEISVDHESTLAVFCSDIQRGPSGDANLQIDPGFVDPDSGDLRLRPGSPCIDTACGAQSTAADLEGNPRKDDPSTPNKGSGDPAYGDLGALEYKP